MRAIDFARARIAWMTHDGSHGFWRVIAAARREDDGEAWFLATGVMAGDVYGHGRLPLQPPYSFQFAASRNHHVIFREPLEGAGVCDSAASHSETFRSLTIEAPELEACALPLDRGILRRQWPLTARLSAAGRDGTRWVLEFPVGHISLRDEMPAAWQVETGPLILPCGLIEVADAAKAGGLQLAFVFFNRIDQADFLAFGPVEDGRRGFKHFGRLEGVEIALQSA